MALLSISTVWFVLHTLIEFRHLTGDNRRTTSLDLGTLIVFLFPPVIMHTVYRESHSDGEPAPPPIFRLPAGRDVRACRPRSAWHDRR